MSPSGAVRAGPPAAQANRTANFNAHEYTLCGKTGGVSVDSMGTSIFSGEQSVCMKMGLLIPPVLI